MAAAACHKGSSWAVGVPVALKPTMTGWRRSMRPRANSSAVPRCEARRKALFDHALPRWKTMIKPRKATARQRNDGDLTELAAARSGVIRQGLGRDRRFGAARKARCVFEIVESHRSAAMKEP